MRLCVCMLCVFLEPNTVDYISKSQLRNQTNTTLREPLISFFAVPKLEFIPSRNLRVFTAAGYSIYRWSMKLKGLIVAIFTGATIYRVL